MQCSNKEKTCPRECGELKNCNCTYTSCSRRGICCECITYHRKNGELPACYFSSADEKKYDRSIDFFIETKK